MLTIGSRHKAFKRKVLGCSSGPALCRAFFFGGDVVVRGCLWQRIRRSLREEALAQARLPSRDLRFGAPQEGGNVADSAPVLNPVAKREQVVLGPFFASVEIRLFGHVIHPNCRALSLASFQAAVRKSARVIETRLSSFLGKLLARS